MMKKLFENYISEIIEIYFKALEKQDYKAIKRLTLYLSDKGVSPEELYDKK